MLKAIAQLGPFLLFLALTAAAGAAVAAPAIAAARRGRPCAAGRILIASGLLFVVAGVLLFAPQPLWVGGVLVAFGASHLACTRSARIGSRS